MQRVSRNHRRSERKLHDDVVIVTTFSYIGDRINSGGECHAAMISRARIGWVTFIECQDLLFGK